MTSLEGQIEALLAERGPLTGGDLRAALPPVESFLLWQTCARSPRLVVRRIGRRYLRLDQKIEGYARLSPSVLREFLTYSVVGPADDPDALEERTHELETRIKEISAQKLRLAMRVVEKVAAQVSEAGEGGDQGSEERFCVLLAGDIVYEMAHDAPRPEKSTGQMVRGSDLDLVFITRDDQPDSLSERLDAAVYQEKYRHMINPSVREEIDYVIKPLARVREQADFADLKQMVPCKILDEAVLVYGSSNLHDAARALLAAREVPQRLAEMEQRAAEARESTERRLLAVERDQVAPDEMHLFCGTEELEEFE